MRSRVSVSMSRKDLLRPTKESSRSAKRHIQGGVSSGTEADKDALLPLNFSALLVECPNFVALAHLQARKQTRMCPANHQPFLTNGTVRRGCSFVALLAACFLLLSFLFPRRPAANTELGVCREADQKQTPSWSRQACLLRPLDRHPQSRSFSNLLPAIPLPSYRYSSAVPLSKGEHEGR